MSVKAVKNIYSLQRNWIKLIDDMNGKIFLTYSFHLAVYKCFYIRKLMRRNNAKELIYFTNGNTIFPAYINRKGKQIFFAGEKAEAGYNDFIGGGEEDIAEVIDYLHNHYKGYMLILRDIEQGSLLNRIYNTQFQRNCYNIPITDGYEKWVKSLKKTTRSNIHTVYNRLSKEGKQYRFYIASKLSYKRIHQIYCLYKKHIEIICRKESGRYSKGDIIKLSFKEKFLPMFLANPFFFGINSIERARVAYTMMDNGIVSFYIMYLEPNGVIISRCAYDSKYAHYNPGTLNMLETIKTMTPQGQLFNFDMSRDFHAYKVWYGGVLYYNYCLEIAL